MQQLKMNELTAEQLVVERDKQAAAYYEEARTAQRNMQKDVLSKVQAAQMTEKQRRAEEERRMMMMPVSTSPGHIGHGYSN